MAWLGGAGRAPGPGRRLEWQQRRAAGTRLGSRWEHRGAQAAAGLRGGGRGACGLHGAKGVRLSSSGPIGPRLLLAMGDVLSTHLDDARRQHIAGEHRSAPGLPGAPPGTPGHASALPESQGRSRGGSWPDPYSTSERVSSRSGRSFQALLCAPFPLFWSLGPHFSTGTCSPWSPAWPDPCTYSLDRVAEGSRPHPSQQRSKPNLYSVRTVPHTVRPSRLPSQLPCPSSPWPQPGYTWLKLTGGWALGELGTERGEWG